MGKALSRLARTKSGPTNLAHDEPRTAFWLNTTIERYVAPLSIFVLFSRPSMVVSFPRTPQSVAELQSQLSEGQTPKNR